ncbi:MAG: hypothetical protein ACLFPE_10425 [Bacteroidales bacterium]
MSRAIQKISLFISIIFCMVMQRALAQEFYMETHVSAHLESILTLNVDPEVKIEFGLKKVNDNLYQITQYPTDVRFSVESTSNWQLSITAVDGFFRGVNDPSQTIPIDFVSYYIENLGKNWDNGPFSNIANKTRDTLLPLTERKNVVLASGRRNNIGGSSRNSFVLRWQFNFEEDLVKMREFSHLNIHEDHFVGRFYITLSESHVTGNSVSLPEPVEPQVKDEPLPEISGTMPVTPGYSAGSEVKKKK